MSEFGSPSLRMRIVRQTGVYFESDFSDALPLFELINRKPSMSQAKLKGVYKALTVLSTYRKAPKTYVPKEAACVPKEAAPKSELADVWHYCASVSASQDLLLRARKLHN